MVILITGSNGQLGLELVNQLKQKKDTKVISKSHKQLDITNFTEVKKTIISVKPDVVINCAAFTDVDKCEIDTQKAYKVNGLGPKHLAIVSQSINAVLVHISTDYVFSGKKATAKKESDLINPRNIYGESKLLGENFVKDFCDKYFIIRTGWLYGQGNNFVNTMLNLANENKEINVVGDQIGSPTSTKELSKAIINLINTDYYGTFHATCKGECSWFDFAKKIFEIKNIDVQVNEITTSEFKQKARRPENSVLDNFMLDLYDMNSFMNWKDALNIYLKY